MQVFAGVFCVYINHYFLEYTKYNFVAWLMYFNYRYIKSKDV